LSAAMLHRQSSACLFVSGLVCKSNACSNKVKERWDQSDHQSPPDVSLRHSQGRQPRALRSTLAQFREFTQLVGRLQESSEFSEVGPKDLLVLRFGVGSFLPVAQ